MVTAESWLYHRSRTLPTITCCALAALLVAMGSNCVFADDAEQVALRLKADEVWYLARSERGVAPGWVSVKDAAEADLVKARDYIERLYEEKPDSLPGNSIGGRMMLRYLNTRIPKNKDTSKSLCIRAVCVYPRSVNLEWTDSAGQKRQYAVSEAEMTIFPDAIKQQMDNWARVLFEISGGKFSLSYTVQPSEHDMISLTRRERDGHYWLSPTPAKRLVEPRKDVMIYVFWLPTWKNHPPMAGGASFSRPQHRFTAAYITVHTNQKRLQNPMGWVNLGGGLPHEFWHYMRYLARENGFKGFLPNDDERGKPGWQQLKQEIELQGLPVPKTEHEDQYATIFTWRFVEKLRQIYGKDLPRNRRNADIRKARR